MLKYTLGDLRFGDFKNFIKKNNFSHTKNIFLYSNQNIKLSQNPKTLFSARARKFVTWQRTNKNTVRTRRRTNTVRKASQKWECQQDFLLSGFLNLLSGINDMETAAMKKTKLF